MKMKTSFCLVAVILKLFILIIKGQNEFDIRLAGTGSTAWQGRVEIYFTNEWRTLCNQGIRSAEAGTICRQLGYTNGGAVITNIQNSFGLGNTANIIGALQCSGNEASISLCQIDPNQLGCTHAQDVGVNCTQPVTNPPINVVTTTKAPPIVQPSNCSVNNPLVRIIGPSDKKGEGFVEVFNNGSWGSVCDDNWDNADAKVVCGMLCFNKSLSLVGQSNLQYIKPNVSKNFLLDDVECTGNEDNIFNCKHRGVGIHNCLEGEYASVKCSKEDLIIQTLPQPRLDCKNENFTISFDYNFDPDLLPVHLTIFDRKTSNPCNVHFYNNSQYLTMTFKHYECDTRISSNDSHLFYTNFVFYNFTSRNGEITRKNSIVLQFICEVLRQTSDDSNLLPKTEFVTQRAPSDYQMTIGLFKDKYFLIPINVTDPQFSMGQEISVAVVLNTTNPYIKLIMPQCVATPSQDRNDPTYHVLIEDNCPKDSTVSISPINRTAIGFSFTSFQFVGRDMVYIHCKGIVCQEDEKTGQCDRSCADTALGRKRRSANVGNSHPVIYGMAAYRFGYSHVQETDMEVVTGIADIPTTKAPSPTPNMETNHSNATSSMKPSTLKPPTSPVGNNDEKPPSQTTMPPSSTVKTTMTSPKKADTTTQHSDSQSHVSDKEQESFDNDPVLNPPQDQQNNEGFQSVVGKMTGAGVRVSCSIIVPFISLFLLKVFV